jgi:hypothetical protein
MRASSLLFAQSQRALSRRMATSILARRGRLDLSDALKRGAFFMPETSYRPGP